MKAGVHRGARAHGDVATRGALWLRSASVASREAAKDWSGCPVRRRSHFQDNFENRRVPEFNTDRDQSLASMHRIADPFSRTKTRSCGSIMTRRRLQLWATKLDLEDRCRDIGGDMFKQVPQADAYSLKTVLHDWSDQECIEILVNLNRAAPRGVEFLSWNTSCQVRTSHTSQSCLTSK
jgi:hypothetical protein